MVLVVLKEQSHQILSVSFARFPELTHPAGRESVFLPSSAQMDGCTHLVTMQLPALKKHSLTSFKWVVKS